MRFVVPLTRLVEDAEHGGEDLGVVLLGGGLGFRKQDQGREREQEGGFEFSGGVQIRNAGEPRVEREPDAVRNGSTLSVRRLDELECEE